MDEEIMNDNPEVKGNELIEKLNNYNLRIQELQEESATKREEAKRLALELSKLNDHIYHYQAQTINESDNLISDEKVQIIDTSKTTEEQNDQLLVYETLKSRLDQISSNLNEVGSFPEKKFEYKDEPIQFQCVCVNFIPPDDKKDQNQHFKKQTFRITHYTKVIDIIQKGLELWDQSDKINSYGLYTFENDDKQLLSQGTVINQLFMEKKAQAKTARFYLLPKNYSDNLNEIGQEQQQGDRNKVNVNQDTNVNEKYYEFIRHFSGVSKYIDKKYTQLKQEESEKEKYEMYERKQTSIFSIVVWGVNALLFLLFFIFSLISIIFIKNPKKNFMEYSLLQNSEDNISQEYISKYIQEKLNYFKKDSTAKLMLASKARLSIYYRNVDHCNSQYSKVLPNTVKCYDTIFEKYKGSIPFECGDNASLCSIFNTDFEGVDNYKIKGNYGTYKGKDCINGFIYPFEMSDSLNETALFVEEKTKDNNFLAFTISLTAYSFISETYYYASYLVESSDKNNEFLMNSNVIPFYPNLKEVKGGLAVFVLDIFRLIFIILIFLAVFKKLFDSIKGKGKNKPNSKLKDTSPSFFETLFSLDVLLDLIVFCLYIAYFSIKVKNLYKDVEKYENTVKTKEGKEDLQIREYYPIADAYETVIQLESCIIICLLLRFFCYLSMIPRVQIFSNYLRLAMIKIFPFFIIYIILILFFAIFANVLFGIQNKNFKDYSSSFLSTLLFSLSHYQTEIYTPATPEQNYQVVYVFMFFVIIIYFEMNYFLGIYLESYRLNSLKYGNIYSERFLNKLMEKEGDKKRLQKLKDQAKSHVTSEKDTLL